MLNLTPVDSVDILAIVDNEVDGFVASHPAITTSGQLKDVAARSAYAVQGRGAATKEMRMNNICCGAHGLSLMITAVRAGSSHTLLFDAGPEEDIFDRNARRLRADFGAVDTFVLSHWHRDHSGGMLQALRMINEARERNGLNQPVTADLHPDRPAYRGLTMAGQPVSMEADPSLAEIGGTGAVVNKQRDAHVVSDGAFLVSGEIPRVTPFEVGLPNGIRFNENTGKWDKDEAIQDERFVACHVRGKGLVVFTGCSHGGAVNACAHAKALAGGDGDGVPLYALVGGYHLADAGEDKIQRTVGALKELGVQVLLPGHCSGWRANLEIERQMPGRLSPCKVGIKFTI